MANGPILALKYKDRRDVKMLSTAHSAKFVNTGKRNREREEIQKPECVHEYNQYMGAVDCSDQMVAYLSFRRRTLKWWKKAFFHILSLAILNSYILYKEHFLQVRAAIANRDDPRKKQQPMLHRKFRNLVVKQMISTSGYVNEATGRRASATAHTLTRLTGRHFLERIPPNNPGGRPPTRVCVVCGPAAPSDATSKRRSSFQCKQCRQTLCIEPCMELYHTMDDYVGAYKRRQEGNNTNNDTC
ncbi:piggyBac transposable element-derived protein 4-like [Branchiostoma floridae]|uniref:PiggyBac transposable element-derived protein 4-like n=1 Tax=Branchiostoma floridae TaxID=7739 RepID=A0A9J7L5L0_BRAFL|nr:piggyBac transposable element-derived protein 4-like [Branchiostoma floridae]